VHQKCHINWPGIEFGPPGRDIGLSHATGQGRIINLNYYLQIQFVTRSKHKHTVSVIRTKQLMQYRGLRRPVASLTSSDFSNRISVFYIKLKVRAADYTNCTLKGSKIFSPHVCCIICTGFATKSLRNMLRVTLEDVQRSLWKQKFGSRQRLIMP